MSPAFIFLCGLASGVLLSLLACWVLCAWIDEPMILGGRK